MFFQKNDIQILTPANQIVQDINLKYTNKVPILAKLTDQLMMNTSNRNTHT